MPDYVVSKTAQILNLYAKSIKNSKVLLLGMAYKPNVDDLRESPGLRMFELFKASGALVDYYDPYVGSFKDKRGDVVKSIPYDLQSMSKYDCMVTVTHHQLLPYKELADLGVPIFDTRNAFKTYDLPHIYKLGTPLTALEEIHLELAY